MFENYEPMPPHYKTRMEKMYNDLKTSSPVVADPLNKLRVNNLAEQYELWKTSDQTRYPWSQKQRVMAGVILRLTAKQQKQQPTIIPADTRTPAQKLLDFVANSNTPLLAKELNDGRLVYKLANQGKLARVWKTGEYASNHQRLTRFWMPEETLPAGYEGWEADLDTLKRQEDEAREHYLKLKEKRLALQERLLLAA